MYTQEDVIKKLKKIKDITEISDLVKEIEDIEEKEFINDDEFHMKIEEYYNKYTFEMNVIIKKESIIGIPTVYLTNKTKLLNTLISISAIKLLEKQSIKYTANEIDDYTYLINVFDSYIICS